MEEIELYDWFNGYRHSRIHGASNYHLTPFLGNFMAQKMSTGSMSALLSDQLLATLHSTNRLNTLDSMPANSIEFLLKYLEAPEWSYISYLFVDAEIMAISCPIFFVIVPVERERLKAKNAPLVETNA